jgi:cephalosporin-C deacetylase-like acetyl esterase
MKELKPAAVAAFKNLFAFIITASIACATQAQNKVSKLTLDDQWKFRVGDDKKWAQPNLNDSDWTTVSIKTTLEEQKGFEQFEGFGWYRKQVIIPDSMKEAIGKGGLIVNYQKVDDCDELYFNGQVIGRTGSFPPAYQSGYNLPREYKVPAQLVLKGKPNIIAVRIYDGGGGGGILSQNPFVRNITKFDKVVMTVDVKDDDKIFLKPQPVAVLVSLTNENQTTVKANLHVEVSTDDYKPVKTTIQSFTLNPKGSQSKSFTVNVRPGFYRYSVYMKMSRYKAEPKKFNLGYEPEQVKGFDDIKSDFNAFWKNNLNELAEVEPNYQLEPQPQYSNNDYEVYEVSMNSFGNELVKGYYAKPKREGKFPVSIEYQGYGSGFYPPNVNWDGFAHMVMSIRGQGYNKPGNKYGDWIVYGLQSKDDYYYRGAFLDAVRAIDFVCTRPEIDTSKIVAQGGSQGGALTFAAAALDKRIKACAPTVPFLSDYRNYFRIVAWPRSSFENYRKDHADVSWEHIYDVLSYFDIKNLAPMVTCPLFMGIGVQDEVCPPHINFAAYNKVKGPKKWIAYADEGHNVGADYYQKRLAFFKEQLALK